MKKLLAMVFVLSILTTSAFAGWEQDSTGWWYKHSDGSYPASAWEKIDGSWYWFNGGGYMVTGLQTIQGKQYYFANSGAMQTGWLQLGDSWYHFSDTGAMTKDAWVGEYYLGSDGVMLTDGTTPDGVRVGKTGKALPTTGVTITITEGDTSTTLTIPQSDLATTVTITSDGVTSTVSTSTGPRNEERDGPYGVVTPAYFYDALRINNTITAGTSTGVSSNTSTTTQTAGATSTSTNTSSMAIAPSPYSDIEGRIINGDVNMRLSPTMDSETVYRGLDAGTFVEILEMPSSSDPDPWYKVYYDGTTGYIRGMFIQVLQDGTSGSTTTNNQTSSNASAGSTTTTVPSSGAASTTTNTMPGEAEITRSAVSDGPDPSSPTVTTNTTPGRSTAPTPGEAEITGSAVSDGPDPSSPTVTTNTTPGQSTAPTPYD